MDKYEYNLKLEEINKLVEHGNYEDAAAIADTIDWRRVRNARTLCMVSEIYEANDRMEDSKAVLMRAYRRSQMGRRILYRLTEVAVKMGEFDEAIEYYSEFVDNAPNDNSRYVLKYEIYKGRVPPFRIRYRSLRSTRRESIQSGGPMSWRSCITRPARTRSAWRNAMTWCCGSIRAIM